MNTKLIIGYFAFVIIIFVGLLFVTVKDKQYKQDMYNDLLISHGVNVTMGEQLVQCENGSLDVYKPYLEFSNVCGELVSVGGPQ